jgi:DMSO/TMAO reductase YedYZ molybdopterin-dependent catalytic subunit
MVRVGGMGYACAPEAEMGSRISDMRLTGTGEPIEADKTYTVGGWASVNEGTEGPAIYDLMGRLHHQEIGGFAGSGGCGRPGDPVMPSDSTRPGHFGMTTETTMNMDKHLREDLMVETDPKPTKKAASRRDFLKAGLLGGAAVAPAPARRGAGDPLITEIQDWNRYLGEGVDARPMASRRSLKPCGAPQCGMADRDPVSSINFTPLHELDGIITPNGLCFERHHGGTAVINPADHRLMINGLVDTPLVFTMEDLKRFPRENRVYFLECAANGGMEWRGAQLNGCQFTHGMIHCVMYTGVPLRYLLEEAGVKTNGKWVAAEGADASAMTRSIPMEKALDDCLVAFKMNGEALRPEQGYPLRLVRSRLGRQYVGQVAAPARGGR